MIAYDFSPVCGEVESLSLSHTKKKVNLLTHTHRHTDTQTLIQSAGTNCSCRSHLFEIHNSFVLALDIFSNETSVVLRPTGLLRVPRKGKDTPTLNRVPNWLVRLDLFCHLNNCFSKLSISQEMATALLSEINELIY